MNERFLNKIILGDCLRVMKDIEDKSIDMILCDLPYGTTACRWDSVIPFDLLWKEYNRICTGVMVFTGSEPFSSHLRISNIKNYKYDWIWIKNGVTNVGNAKRMPLRNFENIMVFYNKPSTYNPQGLKPFNKIVNKGKSAGGETIQGENIGNGRGKLRSGEDYFQAFTNYPRQTLYINQNSTGKVHPTQKPVALFEYLIKTYTNEENTVLDNCIGSGTTAIACLNTNRNFIGIEKDEKYYNLALERIDKFRGKI